MALSPALKKRLPLIVGGVVALALIIGGFVWWQGKQRWETTDNAFVQADTTSVSPQIDGYVVEVLVADNQRVEAGQVLLRLDDKDAKAGVVAAEANLAAVTAAVSNVDARAIQEQATIASRAEFTPKEVQTADERVKLVYAVRLNLSDNRERKLSPGLPADAVIRWDSAVDWQKPRW